MQKKVSAEILKDTQFSICDFKTFLYAALLFFLGRHFQNISSLQKYFFLSEIFLQGRNISVCKKFLSTETFLSVKTLLNLNFPAHSLQKCFCRNFEKY